MKSDYYKKMVNRSLISVGNNSRIKKAISKAKSGDETTLAYLGGSITMKKKELGDRGYADASFRFFKERFAPNGKLNYLNCGMNGTSSTIGLIRLERDVLRFHPDIVFVEFSVNDSKDSLNREIFESLIVRILESDSKPALVLIFLQSEAGYTCQGHMQVIGEHYNLPMISLCDAIQNEIEAGRISWSDYADDNIHPHAKGNDMLVEFIAHYYETVSAMDSDKEELTKEPFYGTTFKNMDLLDSGNLKVLSTGGFQKAQTIPEFDKGWIRSKDSDNSPFVFNLKFKNLFIVYKEVGDISEGSIDIYIDGKFMGTYSGYRTFGWSNPAARLVYSKEFSTDHLVEIKMAKGDEAKNFSLLAFGYCDN